MGQGHSGAATSPAIHGGGHSHAQLGHGHHNQVIGHADRSMTLPASGGTVPAYSQSQYQQHQYQQKSNVQPAALQTQISQASQSSQQNEDAQPQRHIERRMSDSSSATSASRRRYRKRDSSLDSTQLDPVTLRPKKNDKASARKSSLNQTELNSQDNGNRVREHTPISSDDGGESNKRRSRYDQIQSSHAKTGVAGLSLSPPPTPSGDPFPVTQEFVTERLSKSPSPLNAQEYPPVRSQPSGERPRNALSPPPTSDRSQVRSPEHVITPRDVTSPRRVLSPEPVSYNRPLSVQDPQHSTSKVNPGIALTRPKSQQDYRPLLSPQQMPVTQQEGRDPRHSGYGLQSSAYQNADVIQAYSPVISKTGPLSPVRSQHTDSAWSSQGPLSPTQRQSGPLSPTSYSQLPPPLQLVTSTMHDRSGISALSPMGRQGPLSPTSLSALSPNRLTSPTPLSPPLSPSIVTSPTRTVAPRQLPRSVSSETGPRSPVPAPVVFPSPRPLSPQPDVTKPKFVPYTSKDLEDAYKQKSSSAAAGKSQNVTQLQSQKLQTQQLQSKQPPQPQLQSQKPQLQQPQSVPLTVGQSKHETTEPSVKKPTSQAQPQLSQPQTLHKTQTPQSAIATQKTTVVQPTTVVTPVKQAAPHPPQEDLVVPQQAVTVSDVPKTSNEDVSDPKPEQRLSGDSEAKRVEAAINRLHRDRSTESPAREDVLPNLRRGSRDVSELVRRFSSDVSDREGSPGGHGNNHSNLPSNLPSNQQGNRGDASNPLLRRTPDRTQSFRQQRQMTPPDSFIRAKSFREKKNGGQDSVADEQLKAILKRRSQNIDEWEEKVAGQAAPVLDKVTEVETQRFESRFKSTHSPSPVPIDRELSSALQVRRAREERESSGSQRSSESESNTKTTLNVPRSTNKVIETVDKSDRVTQKETVPAENVAVKTEKVLVQQRKTTESLVKPEPIKSATAEVEIKTVESKLKVTSPASSSTSSSTSSSSSKTSTKTSSETSSSSEKTSTQSTTQSSEPDTDSLPSKVGNKPESSTVGRSAPAETKQDEPSNKSITQPTKQPITQPITQTVTQPVKQAITQPVKKMTNETTASIITVAPVKLATKEVAKTNIGVAAALPQVAQDKAQERVSSVQSLKLRPAMNDVTNLQRSSHRIELTRSESLQGQGCDRPPLRKTQTVDLGGLEGERVACNLPMEQVSSVRRRSVHSPTPESELQGAEKEAKRTSVAERIFQMETKVDDLYTPRSGTSGAMTPRVIKLRSSTGPSGTGSPRRGQEVAAPMTLTSTPEKVVSDQLMARLGDMALMQEAAVRRQQSQQKGPQDSRRRTQPVTLEEVQQASALESVESFRAEISKNADGNQFNKSKGIHHVYKSKGRESFPQPFHREKLKDRRKDKRYQTQPITTEELGDIPEMQPLVLPERPPRRTLFNLDLTSDSDIELDQLVQVNYSKLQGQTQEMRGQKNQQDPSDNTDTTDKDNSEAQDDLSKMSVMQKMSLFRKMEEHKTPDMTPRSKRRFLDRKKRLERSRTQPITEEELTQASELAAAENGSKDTQQENEETQDTQERDEENGEENERQNQNGGEDEIKMRSAVSSDNVSKMDLAEDGTIDELSRMSLAEKMKLFSESNKSSEEKETKRDAPVLRRKARRAQSRFKTQDTQPITVEEVEKAKISPLAVTMIKPPDPELLQNMSVRDQREFLTEYARANFRASGLFKQSSTEEPPASQKDQKKTAKEPEISSVSTASTVTPSTEATPNEKLTTDVTTTVTPSAVTSTVTTVETTVTTIDTPVTTPAAAGVTPQVTSAPSSGNESKSEKAGSKKEVMRKQRQKQIEQRLQDSSTEDETFDKIQRIKNEAIARRRRMMEMRKAGESRFHSQPVDGSQLPKKENGGLASEEEKPCGHVRHKTQPVTESEKASLNARPNSPNSRGSIHDRENDNDQGLAQLRQHGEEDWKKRVRGRDVKSVDFSHVKLRDKSKKQQPQPEPSQPTVDQRPKSIADRLSKLEISQETWKDRVEEKDVSQFTVEGKLNRAGKTTTPDSPLVARRKKIRAPLTRAHSSPLPLPIDSSETVSSELEDKAPTKIEVPEANDDEFQSFFSTQDVTAISEPIDVTVDDFDHIFMESEDMLPTTKKIRPQRKQRTTKNPLKTLAARDDIQSEYTEVRTDIADKELRRIKREQIAGTAGFAEEALAGLASKENFSKVNLRKTDSFGSSTPSGTSGKYEPFQEIMLLHVKGRRHCQVRLVEPSSSSLNSGDSFVLVTSDKVYVWIGEYCNIIEKSKATDVAAIIQQKRDLGCKCYQEPTVIYEKRQDSPGSRGFWDALGGKQEYQTPGPVEEDELYETYMTETNKVWMLDAAGETLVALEDYKGTVLPYALLNTKIALVFDFGSEFYVWTGKQVPFVSRKIALRLAREQFERGYDYSKFDINPFSPLITPENGGLPQQSDSRPEWALFGKVNENMETILFREKFVDWPDSSRLIKVKTESDDQKSEPTPELEPCDASKMIAVKNVPVDLLLDGSHIGRGQKWVDKTEGITREFEILTLSIQVWHILEYDHSQVEDIGHGQFHDGDTYVVRWHYMVSQASRTLKGQEARHSMTGRERCAYFFWQGRNSSINEKGASALMTVELDEERGPQVRVIQGKEPPYFVQLFKGRMITHLGKREDESTNSQGAYRMYLVRNELPKEAYLAEVRCNISNLRSRGVYLLLNVKTGICQLWIGCKTSTHTRDRGRELANNLVNKCPLEVGLHPKAHITITEVEEGKEKSEFWAALDSSHRSLYFSLLNVSKPCQFTMRIFTMSSVSGIFEATELLNPCRSQEIASPFPFIQSDLYRLSQPSLVMVDAGPEVWVWQGWWPEGTEDSENIKTGSAHSRFNTERKLALRTTISYCTEKFGKSGSKDRAFVTYAGLEPLSFTNLFPHWTTRDDVTDLQLKEGRHVGERRKVEELLVQLNKNNYAWSELQQHPLPEGVDPLRLESYLNDEEFLEMLGMPKEDFYNIPTWKQGNLKKTVGLF